MSSVHKICTSIVRSTPKTSPGLFLQTNRHFTALVSRSSAQIPRVVTTKRVTKLLTSLHGHDYSVRHYSLDRPSSPSNPFSLFSSSSNDSSPYGQNLEMTQWPIRKANTILNIVPQGKRMVVERFGKLHAIHESGYFIAVPILDSIAYVIDIRERALDIVPQSAITRDNVSVEVSGNLFVSVVDPEKAAYGSRNPLYSVMMVSHLDCLLTKMKILCTRCRLHWIYAFDLDLIWMQKGPNPPRCIQWFLSLHALCCTTFTLSRMIFAHI